MRFNVPSLALSLLLVSTSLAIAQQSPSTATSSPQALQLIQQTLLAQGATTFPSSIVATGTIHSADSQTDGTFEVVAQGPRTYRTTTTRDSGSYVYLMNDGIGAVTWKGKTRHVGGAEVMAARCPFFPMFSFIGESTRPDVVLGPVRTGTLNGNASYILSTVNNDLSNPSMPLQSLSEMEVDAKSLLPLKLRMQLVHSENIEIVSHLEYSYDDYRQEGALLLPHPITLTVNGAPAFVVTLTNFQFNVAAELKVAL